MLAFHNDPKIKTKYLKRVRKHFLADEIIKGQYWGGGKGSAIGCTIHGDEHNAYEVELGIPELLANLEDHIFEGLPNELAKTWPDRFLSAIEVGADLSRVWPKFAIFLLTDESQCNSKHPQCDVVAKHFQDKLDGFAVNWGPVRRAAKAAAATATIAADTASAAGYAANTAAYHTAEANAAAYAAVDASIDAYYAASADASAANAAYCVANAAYCVASAASAAAYAANTAVYAAADATAYDSSAYAIRSKSYTAQSEKLLELLKNT